MNIKALGVSMLLLGNTLVADLVRDAAKGIVVDKQRNLEWQDNQVSKKGNWKYAFEYCSALDLDAKDDWRVPSLEELKTIKGRTQDEQTLNNVFVHVAPDGYWSQETYEGFRGFAWIVHFRTGNIYNYAKSTPIYTRCVRDSVKK